MGAAATTTKVTKTLEVPGAILASDIRPNSSTTEPPPLPIGSPTHHNQQMRSRTLPRVRAQWRRTRRYCGLEMHA